MKLLNENALSKHFWRNTHVGEVEDLNEKVSWLKYHQEISDARVSGLAFE